MPVVLLAKLVAELLPPDSGLLLALAGTDGRLLGQVHAPAAPACPTGMDGAEDRTITHLDELLDLYAHEPETERFACSGGCCAATVLRSESDGGSVPMPFSALPASARPVSGLLFASCRPERYSPEAAKFMRLALDSLAKVWQCRSAEQNLLERLRFAESIVRSMSSGFLILTPELRVTAANPAAAELLQTTEKKLINAKLTDLIFSELQVRRVFSTGKPLIDEEVFIKLAGKTVHILKTCVPVFNARGEVIAALDHFREIKEVRQLVSRTSGTSASFSFEDIIYSSRAMGEAVEMARLAAGNSLSVLIHGESGTGKELFAHAIHQASSRHCAPFIVIDCASMPRELVESELFGYVEGAFTGARRGGRPGKFELANNGTIFLDELGELPLEMQSRLLRVLQSRQVVRLGGVEHIPVDIRIIAATNRNLHEEVRLGNFRADLFHRLNVLVIQIPPLRSNPEDILVLAEYFLDKYRSRFNRPELTLSQAVREELQSSAWPGNARELENAVARAVQLCRDKIEPGHVRLNSPAPGERPRAEALFSTPDFSLDDIERKAFQNAVAACNGNISDAARRLGVARSTVYKKLRPVRSPELR
ncbi:MAG: sigma 54-interacting transcriptional regulator [Deltaproteobacteria bacterium]|jgi:transcriptional regulator with PAS, ATPase and Fis domain|nr:sigma 54-interacting transcriptional regulator [Deltaproteobacteria bacterium]